MRLATLRTANGGTRAVRIDGTTLTETGHEDVGDLLGHPDWQAAATSASGPTHAAESADLAPVVPHPGKILCVGLNYRTHILEMGRDLPQYPTIFAKYPEALVGPSDTIALAPESTAVDWEAELAVVIGRTVRRAGPDEAAAAIAGFAVLNDVTMRDWQYRTAMWLQGKTWEGTTPFGPHLVTPDELAGGVRPSLRITAALDGETVQEADTADLVFDPVALVVYLSTILTLRPGDVIATGTPGGVGHARTPKRYLADGSTLVTEVESLGRLVNVARTEAAS